VPRMASPGNGRNDDIARAEVRSGSGTGSITSVEWTLYTRRDFGQSTCELSRDKGIRGRCSPLEQAGTRLSTRTRWRRASQQPLAPSTYRRSLRTGAGCTLNPMVLHQRTTADAARACRYGLLGGGVRETIGGARI
jgi:hypothetical protein